MKLQEMARKGSMVLALAATLAGCGGLGQGNGPVSAAILPQGGLSGDASTKAFTCLPKSLGFIVTFNDGSAGDFASRTTFTSSNPAVARVSNGDIAVPEQTGLVYLRGTILPGSPGTTTITANYLSFSRSIVVTVRDPQSFKITPATIDVAAKSVGDLNVVMVLDGVETAVDSAVSWAFVTPNTAVATIGELTGLISGVAAGGPLTARARIPGCGLTADATVNVANLQSLALTREFGSNPNLIVGTSEKVIATGTLDNGRTQDLSGQVTYTTSDASALSFFGGSLANLALAVKASSAVQIGASFTTLSIAAAPITITPVADSLSSISVSPTAVDVLAGANTSFKATGNYASGATQDLTRHVGWNSSDFALANIQSSFSSTVVDAAGQVATAGYGAGKSVTITASATSGANQAITATGTLNLK